jgi:uncharacterized membrane protein
MECQIKDKKKVLKGILDKIDVISQKTNLSKLSIGHLIRTFHYITPFLGIFSALYGPKYLVILSIIFLIIVYLFFIIFNGCILSSLETILIGDGFYITDPALEICKMEINNKNRFKISYIVGPIYLFIFFFIIYMRFFYKK